jgi:peptidoglycan/LPS O-acetylase OafA/YrhL
MSDNNLNAPGPARKLPGLELLRFVCALAVLTWHYQHFSYVADVPTRFNQAQQPFFSQLQYFYQYGHYGVQVFWCISGFIFFWKYRPLIARQEIEVKTFFVLRFSRLYPLHIATLVFTLVLQTLYFQLNNFFFVYQHNDSYHLLLHLFFASHWGIETGYAFNAPVWSVSVEVLVYGLFFLGLRFLGQSLGVNIAVLLAYALANYLNMTTALLDCMAFFYAGGVFAIASTDIQNPATERTFKAGALVAVVALPVLVAYLATVQRYIPIKLILLVYAPLLIYCASFNINMGDRVGRWLETAGNLTYGSYLLHFPLQLLMVLFLSALGTAVPFYSPAFFTAFVGLTFLTAYFVYKHFEIPVQNTLRHKLGPASGKASIPTPATVTV